MVLVVGQWHVESICGSHTHMETEMTTRAKFIQAVMATPGHMKIQTHRNKEYVTRSLVKSWLMINASPRTLESLANDLANASPENVKRLDQKMIADIIHVIWEGANG